MKQITVRLEDELLEETDQARGDIPRERWIRAALIEKLRSKVPEQGPLSTRTISARTTRPPTTEPPAPPPETRADLARRQREEQYG